MNEKGAGTILASKTPICCECRYWKVDTEWEGLFKKKVRNLCSAIGFKPCYQVHNTSLCITVAKGR